MYQALYSAQVIQWEIRHAGLVLKELSLLGDIDTNRQSSLLWGGDNHRSLPGGANIFLKLFFIFF